jgi:hypothetical protein
LRDVPPGHLFSFGGSLSRGVAQIEISMSKLISNKLFGFAREKWRLMAFNSDRKSACIFATAFPSFQMKMSVIKVAIA